MKRGKYMKSYVHQSCALKWYLDNPKSAASAVPKVLQFSVPRDDVAAFYQRFVDGTA